jgi:hypothetical protein
VKGTCMAAQVGSSLSLANSAPGLKVEWGLIPAYCREPDGVRRSSELVLRLNGTEATEGMFDMVFGRNEGVLLCTVLFVCLMAPLCETACASSRALDMLTIFIPANLSNVWMMTMCIELSAGTSQHVVEGSRHACVVRLTRSG